MIDATASESIFMYSILVSLDCAQLNYSISSSYSMDLVYFVLVVVVLIYTHNETVFVLSALLLKWF